MSLIKFNYNTVVARLYPKDCPLMDAILAMPELIRELINLNKCFIAGGFIRRWWGNLKQDSDIDLFFDNKETCNDVIESFKKITPIISVNEFNTMFSIKMNDTWTLKIQCIRLYYATMEELLDNFDFTICGFGFDGKNIVMTENALIDFQRKRLVPHKIRFGGVASLRRIIKYTGQGFYMCAGASAEFLRQVGEIYVNNPEEITNAKIKYID